MGEEEKSDLVEECDESSVQKMRGMGEKSTLALRVDG